MAIHKRLIQLLFVIIIITVIAADTCAEDALSIIAVGDVMMGSSYPDEMLPPDDGAGIFDTQLRGIAKKYTILISCKIKIQIILNTASHTLYNNVI